MEDFSNQMENKTKRAGKWLDLTNTDRDKVSRTTGKKEEWTTRKRETKKQPERHGRTTDGPDGWTTRKTIRDGNG